MLAATMFPLTSRPPPSLLSAAAMAVIPAARHFSPPLRSLVTSSTSPFERENALFVSENCAGLSSSNSKGLIDGALEE